MNTLQASSGLWPGFKVRSRAALIHLGATGAVAALAAALVFGVWYPFPYRDISGGRELFLLIIAVDLVVGPLLTFAVFNPGKGWRLLRRDLVIVATLQLAALGYGLHTVWLARPVYLVHEVDRFRVVTAADIDPQDLDKAPPAWQRLPVWGPQVIGTRAPRSTDDNLILVTMAAAGKEISMQPDWWQPLGQSRDQVLAKAKPVEHLRTKFPAQSSQIQAAVQATGKPERELRVLPVVARKDWSALIDASTGRPVAYLPLDGF